MSDLRHYDVIVSPAITEKSTMASEQNQVVFNVARKASKPEIKAAIEALFNVKVTGVNTLVRKGKVKRFRGTVGRQSDVKRAIVTLADGHTKGVRAVGFTADGTRVFTAGYDKLLRFWDPATGRMLGD